MPYQEHEKERERERDQTRSYWYIPSAPRVNYSLLIMESAEMMKMPTGDGSPLRQGAGTGSRLGFGGYRGLQRWDSRSILFSDRFRVYGYICIGGRNTSGEPRGAHEGGGRAQGSGRTPLPRDLLTDPLTCTPCLLGFFPSKNEFREVSGQLDSV